MDKGLNRLNARRKKKRTKRLLLVTLLIAIFVAIIFLSDLSPKTVTIKIKEGTPSSEIAEILKDEGVIHSKTYFLLRLRFSQYNDKLKYGTFKLDTNDSLDEIFEILSTKGEKGNTVKLTIPEGFSVEKIKERVVSMGLCTDSEFESALKKNYDFDFLNLVPHDNEIEYALQGFLFPSTYEFYADATAETVVQTLLAEFKKQITPYNIPNEKLYEVITLASMVEREAKLQSERARIAGVLKNRIAENMPLQIDATVVYAISDGLYDVDKVYYKDLETKSRYNTYKYLGLPVGPICNPSIESIKAALYPENHKYLYYHTDTKKNDGSHIFTETYQEHVNSQ